MSDTKVLWHDVITHAEDGELHRQSFGPGQIMPGTEEFIDLEPGQTVTIRRVKPLTYLEPGSYWTRFRSGAGKVGIAEWSGAAWFYAGVSASDEFDVLEVVSDRLVPPTIEV